MDYPHHRAQGGIYLGRQLRAPEWVKPYPRCHLFLVYNETNLDDARVDMNLRHFAVGHLQKFSKSDIFLLFGNRCSLDGGSVKKNLKMAGFEPGSSG